MKQPRIVIFILAGLLSLALIVLLGLNRGSSGRAEEGGPILKYPDFPPTPTVSTPPTSKPSVASARLAQSDFSDASALSNWQFVDLSDVLPEDQSVWKVEGGALVQNRTANAGNPSIQETLALVGDPKWADYTITTKVYDQNNATFGLVARRNGNSFYRYRAIANTYPDTPKQVLEKVVNGVATSLATLDKPGYDQRTWHVVSLSVSGSHIRATLDGTVVAEATDTTLASGQAGLYTRAIGGIRFDDVAVTTP
jgi:hypothetical protein